MKKNILFLTLILQCFLFSSCDELDSTCVAFYSAFIRIDGKAGDKISVKYIGPNKYNEVVNKKLASEENKLPFSLGLSLRTYCRSKSMEKNDYNFFEITNTSSEDVYILADILGPEIDEKMMKIASKYNILYLMEIYIKQDKDAKYDYTKELKNLAYMDRYELYEKLLKEDYPYILKLEPNKTCIMKWGGYGFEIL